MRRNHALPAQRCLGFPSIIRSETAYFFFEARLPCPANEIHDTPSTCRMCTTGAWRVRVRLPICTTVVQLIRSSYLFHTQCMMHDAYYLKDRDTRPKYGSRRQFYSPCGAPVTGNIKNSALSQASVRSHLLYSALSQASARSRLLYSALSHASVRSR